MPGRERSYEIRHGDVWFVQEPSSAVVSGMLASMDVHVCDGSEHLAVAWQDGEDGISVMKHGSAALVEKWADNQRTKLAAAGFDEMAAGLCVVSFPVHEETVALLNRVASGVSHDLLARLEALQGTVPESRPYPR